MEMDERQKLMIAAGVGVLLVGVLLYLTYKAYQQKEQAQKDIATYQGRIRKAREQIKEIPALRQKEFELNNAVTEYVRILPTTKEVEKMYDTVEELENEAGVTLVSYRIVASGRGRRRMSANFQMHTRDIKLKGGFFAITKFINLIERYKRFMRVENFDMKPGDSLENLDSTLKFSTFTYTPPRPRTATRK